MLVASKRLIPFSRYLLACAAIMLAAAIIERCMGRLMISHSGRVFFWVGKANSAENSQQIADWYSFSHVIHGFLLYGLFNLVGRRRWPIGLCLLLAILLESGWEVFENTPYVIHYYRSNTMSWGYSGDTIVNSMSDILFAAIGFAVACFVPVWLTLVLAIAMEMGVALVIRDNLTLNMIMFIHPFQCIKHWQMGG